MKGAGIILWSSSWISVSESITFRMPGMQNTPAAVATQYSNPCFLRELKSIICERKKEAIALALVLSSMPWRARLVTVYAMAE
jgi:hypothetical protein